MNKCYYRIEWKNYPSDETPLNEQNLNKIDVAADEMDNRIISLDSTKFDKSEAQLLVKYIEYDEDTGIFKITHYNGASYTIDTLLEKLAVNFDYDYQTQQLIIELSDGEIKYVDLSALITQYEFLDSETVAFSVDNGGKVTAIVKEGSIEEKHLRPDYLADIKVESAKAEASVTKAGEKANDSAQSALLSKSYSDGDSGIRDGEANDNAKYYSEQAKKYYENLEQAGTVTGVKGNSESNYRTGNVNLTAQNVGALPTTGGTMTGPIYSNSHIYNSDGTFDIDLDGNIFDIGIRDSQNKSWIRRLIFSNSNDIRMECGEKLDLVGKKGGKQWDAAIGSNLIWKGNGDSSLEIKGDGGGTLHFEDSADISSGGELCFYSNRAMRHTSRAGYYTSVSGETDLRSGGKFSIRSGGDIQLTPGTTETNSSVAADKYVKIGHIKGIKDTNGKKPSITNFGNINSETYNGKKVITSAGGVIDEGGSNDNRSIELSNDGMQFNLPTGGFAGGMTYIEPNGSVVGKLGFFRTSVQKYFFMGDAYNNPNGQLKLRQLIASDIVAAESNDGSKFAMIGAGFVNISDEDFGNISIDPSSIYKYGSTFSIFVNDEDTVGGFIVYTSDLSPRLNNMIDLGSHCRWRNIYATNGTIQTSDRTKKTNITPLSDVLTKDFIMGLIPSSYGMVDGTSGRMHWGLISQDIEELMDKLGMDSNDFAGFIKSPKVIMHTTDEDGNLLESPIEEVIEGEYEYSLRYDEFVAPLVKMVQMQQQEINEQRKEIDSLKKENQEMREKLKRIEKMLGI